MSQSLVEVDGPRIEAAWVLRSVISPIAVLNVQS